MQPNTRPPTPLRWFLVMLLLAFGCVATMLFAADRLCSANIEQWTPFYPGAALTDQQHNFLRPRAMGISRVILSSPDDPETVRQFYRDHTLALLRAEQSRGIASTNWRVEPDGTGSLIVLDSQCGQ